MVKLFGVFSLSYVIFIGFMGFFCELCNFYEIYWFLLDFWLSEYLWDILRFMALFL